MSDTTITILDVGHGNSTVITSGTSNLVIDAGARSFLLEYLIQNNIDCIDYVLISHADQDHIGGLLALLSCEEIKINHVRLNTDSDKESDIWDDLLFELTEQDKNGGVDFQISLTSGSGEEFSCGLVRVEVLAPNKYFAGKGPGSKDRSKRIITTNSNSAVVKLTYEENAIALLTGDLDQVGLHRVLSDGVDMRSATLIYPHHGGGSGKNDSKDFAEELIRAVEPKNILFSIGRGKYNTPHPEIIGKIKELDSKICVMCTQLSTHCSVDIPISKSDYSGDIYSQGHEKGLCCAGSIEINIEDGSIELPCKKAHDTFITDNVPNALCK